mmetsp:Transcript_8900/g.7781  ORF Transcript_8900/g.7781 Transcript_8900/m.7781 type:complete len:90 (+) Transcript_8900:57-326(+)
MSSELSSANIQRDHPLNKIATHLLSTSHQPETDFYNHIMLYQRLIVHQNTWYFAIQTLTTVGYGDISATNTTERLFRAFLMIISVILFS